MRDDAVGLLRRLGPATRHSLKGLAAAWKHEPAFRLEMLLTPLLLIAAVMLGDSATERALLAGSWLLVPLAELLNSAIESVVDRIGAERHELSGRAKDLGSAAVFWALLAAGIVWLTVLAA